MACAHHNLQYRLPARHETAEQPWERLPNHYSISVFGCQSESHIKGKVFFMQNYDLARFVTAQNGVFGYDRALAEIRAGRKQSHWMWYIFPQLTGLGRSETARFYGIRDLGGGRRLSGPPGTGSPAAGNLRRLAGAGKLRRPGGDGQPRPFQAAQLHDFVSRGRSHSGGVPAGAGQILRRPPRRPHFGSAAKTALKQQQKTAEGKPKQPPPFFIFS